MKMMRILLYDIFYSYHGSASRIIFMNMMGSGRKKKVFRFGFVDASSFLYC